MYIHGTLNAKSKMVKIKFIETNSPMPNPRATLDSMAAPVPQNTTENVPNSSAMQDRSSFPLTRSDFRGNIDQPPIFVLNVKVLFVKYATNAIKVMIKGLIKLLK